MIIELLRLATFLAFLAIGAIVARSRGARHGTAVNALLLYVLLLHAALVLTGRDDWPFTPYPLIEKTTDADAEYRKVVFCGVDASGREWLVDPDAWSPVAPPVLMQWFVTVFPRLDAPARAEAGRFLLARAEQRRAAIVAGRRPPKQRLLGPLAAPDWWVYSRPPATSAAPFVALRVYIETFTPRARLAGAPPHRQLVMESR